MCLQAIIIFPLKIYHKEIILKIKILTNSSITIAEKREITIKTDLAAFEITFSAALRARVAVTKLCHVCSYHTNSVFVK